MKAIFLDLECSGLDIYRHRVLEIAFKIIQVNSGEELFSYHKIVKQTPEIWAQRDLSSIEINGFTWEKSQQGEIESIIREDIIKIFDEQGIERGKAIYICQNPAFDRAFFSQLVDVYTQEKKQWPYHWLDFASMYWALLVQKIKKDHSAFPEEIHLSKNSIAQVYGLPQEPYPHCAMNGVDHLLACYKAAVGFI